MWHDFVFSKGRSILGGPRVVILQALDFMGHPSLGGDWATSVATQVAPPQLKVGLKPPCH